MRKVFRHFTELRAPRPRPPVAAARAAAMTIVAAVAGAVLAGCAQDGLSRDEQVRMLMARTRRCEDELLAARRTIESLTAAGARPGPAPPPEDPFRPVAVRFGKYSGIVDADLPRAEQRLRVIIEPLDSSGDVVKRAGSLELEAWVPPAASPAAGTEPPRDTPAPPAAASAGRSATAPAAPAPQPQIYRWTFSADEMRQAWLSGLGTYGYVLRLPWSAGRAPTGDRLAVRAKFTTLAGEVFQAETEVSLPAPPQAGAAPR